jgi:two-component system, LuxR family, sensor kinase FixL
MKTLLRIWRGFLDRASALGCTHLGLMLVGCIAFLDYWTDPQLSFSVFYLVPISLVTWYGNRRSGMFISVLAVAALLAVDLNTKPRDLDSAAPYWNAAAQFSIFLVVVLLLGSIRKFNKELETMVGSRTVRLREETDGHTRGAQTAHEREELFRQMAENIREVFWVTDSGKDHAAEERIRQLASIANSAQDAIISTNLEGIIVTWNRAAERLYGYTQDEILGQPVLLLAGPELTDEPIHVLEQNVNESGIETLHQRKNGDRINVSLAISPIVGDDGRAGGFSVIARDMTERRRLEREVLEISAAERRSIGHDLHDGVGQHLAGTAFKAKLLQEMLRDTAPRLAAQAGEVVGLINAGIDQVRRLAHGLDPIEVEAAGLEAALSQLADDTRTVYRVACDFHCNQTVPSPEPVISLQLFRIAQEAVHNALEHGHAKSIQIALTASDSMACIDITDDGSGFSFASKAHAGGLGLRIMKYRARTIGGFLLVDSKIGSGTRITCLIPALRETGCEPEAQIPRVPPLQKDNPPTPPHEMVK